MGSYHQIIDSNGVTGRTGPTGEDNIMGNAGTERWVTFRQKLQGMGLRLEWVVVGQMQHFQGCGKRDL